MFESPEYCNAEICRIRESIGTTKATDETFHAALETLVLMRVYAPKECLPVIDSQLTETERRYDYFKMRHINTLLTQLRK